MARVPLDFKDHVYVVTGGSSGIGRAIVTKLLDLSAVVHAIDIQEKMDPMPSSTPPGTFYFYPGVDVSSREKVSEAFKLITERSPKIDGLVNSAGIAPIGPDLIESDECFQRIMSVNVGGVWNAGTECLQRLVETSSGTESSPVERIFSMVNIGASASLQGFSRVAVYSASKHAILGLTRSWAKDFASRGARINCVAPGFTDTPLLKAGADDLAGMFDQVPMKRWASPSEIADVAVYLLSDASSYITGQVIPVNGGWH
ncbi:3-oxoacyl-[acyl-carrier-protein] reductase FabG [Penicillium rolfsii]|nr:3-oxoacyl-[acyl-carrier-protein] reductase FabG [Penicillium rolfsii]